MLKKGGSARIMIYHKWSMVGIMLWVRYALLRLRGPGIPWTASMPATWKVRARKLIQFMKQKCFFQILETLKSKLY